MEGGVTHLVVKVLSSPCTQTGKRRHLGSGQMRTQEAPSRLGKPRGGALWWFLTSVLLGKRAVTNYRSLITPRAISIIVSRKKKCDELSRERKQPQEKRSQRSPGNGACGHPREPWNVCIQPTPTPIPQKGKLRPARPGVRPHTHGGPVCNTKGRAPREDLGTLGIHQALRSGEPSRGSARFLEANCLSLR